jgi:hypothetical protein
MRREGSSGKFRRRASRREAGRRGADPEGVVHVGGGPLPATHGELVHLLADVVVAERAVALPDLHGRVHRDGAGGRAIPARPIEVGAADLLDAAVDPLLARRAEDHGSADVSHVFGVVERTRRGRDDGTYADAVGVKSREDPAARAHEPEPEARGGVCEPHRPDVDAFLAREAAEGEASTVRQGRRRDAPDGHTVAAADVARVAHEAPRIHRVAVRTGHRRRGDDLAAGDPGGDELRPRAAVARNQDDRALGREPPRETAAQGGHQRGEQCESSQSARPAGIFHCLFSTAVTGTTRIPEVPRFSSKAATSSESF